MFSIGRLQPPAAFHSRRVVSQQDGSPSPLKVASTLETSAVRRIATAAASPTARISKRVA